MSKSNHGAEYGDPGPDKGAASPSESRWVPWSLGVGGALLVVVLLLVAARPPWAMRWWDASGLDCGRGLSVGKPEDLASVWAGWGEGQHELSEDLELEDHRASIEELSAQLEMVPVGEIPAHASILGDGGSGAAGDVDVAAQGALIRAEVRGEDGLSHLGGIDPATGTPIWHWDLDDGRDTWVAEHGGHLVLVNRIVRGHNVFEGDLWTDMLSVGASTGERQGCHRFSGFPGYGAGSTEDGLVVGTESWNPMGDDDEQEVGTRTVQQVTLPRFSGGFERTLPTLDDEGPDGMVRSRPQGLVTLPGGTFLTYAAPFSDGGNDAFTKARNDLEFPSDVVPVEAFSMGTGEPLWSYGEPGDRVAFVSGVQALPGEASGVLLAELGEFAPRADYPERGTSAVTLRMLDADGNQLWKAGAADIGSEHFGGSESERYLRVLDDVVLVHTAPHVVTALDAVTGEKLWSIDEGEGEPQPLWLHEAVSVDGQLFLPGHERNYMVDARTGEPDEGLADAMVDAHVENVSALDGDMLLVETREYGHVILQER